ncbi:hypothetical protein [Streptomyces sp. NPDC097619]|uniref:hypothetical protein n=1 Tax=Streptomyces sp. NPDC097619 TaxID=3157228 RepID=UPI0033182BC2
MSYGQAYPSIAEILPGIGYADPVGASGAADAAGTLGSFGSLGDTAHQALAGLPTADSLTEGVRAAGGHALDSAGHLLGELLEPAAVALGALSGALLVGRAAMVGAHVLTSAAVRAAAEQECLERAQAEAAAAAAQWEAAAFAAVRANARRLALLARIRRTAYRTLPDTPPPPLPDLPPALVCVGTRLDVLRRDLAVLEKALHEAETAHALWTTEQVVRVDADPAAEESWRRRARARREAALRALPAEPAAAPAPLPQPPGREALDPGTAVETGTALLALLDPAADRTDAELAVTAVRHAVACAAERPDKARTHLREARRFVADANRTARARAAALEKAAVRLDFLVTAAPPGQPPLPPAPEETALLRKALEEGRPLTTEEERAVDRKVEERLADLECRYTRELLERAVRRLAERGGPPDGARTAAPGTPEAPLRFDLTPGGWWPGHWLRITVRDGVTELVTMYREGPGPRTTADLALDAQRCREARGHLEELRTAAARLGLELPLDFTESGRAVAGVRGEDGALVLDGGADPGEDTGADPGEDTAAGAAPAGRRPEEARRARRVGEERRSSGR